MQVLSRFRPGKKLAASWIRAYLGTIPAIENHVPDPIEPTDAPPL